ncbi:hypothetical protein Scep_022601 [Stephania cephalantha]|uniref:Uncharacterized protein n=1 Tax=Stephania cephalantha TaxID=152367 RepID=A0AAP0F8E1_9MAGN
MAEMHLKYDRRIGRRSLNYSIVRQMRSATLVEGGTGRGSHKWWEAVAVCVTGGCRSGRRRDLREAATSGGGDGGRRPLVVGGDGGRGDWWATGIWEASTGVAGGTRRLVVGAGDKWETLGHCGSSIGIQVPQVAGILAHCSLLWNSLGLRLRTKAISRKWVEPKIDQCGSTRDMIDAAPIQKKRSYWLLLTGLGILVFDRVQIHSRARARRRYLAIYSEDIGTTLLYSLLQLPNCLAPLLPHGSITASTAWSIATCSNIFGRALVMPPAMTKVVTQPLGTALTRSPHSSRDVVHAFLRDGQTA